MKIHLIALLLSCAPILIFETLFTAGAPFDIPNSEGGLQFVQDIKTFSIYCCHNGGPHSGQVKPLCTLLSLSLRIRNINHLSFVCALQRNVYSSPLTFYKLGNFYFCL